jgi:hypothetical protein
MLAVHDERINVQARTDEDICKKVEDIEGKIDNLYKFRWQIGGVVALALVIVGLIPTFMPTLTTLPMSDRVERAK